jgi:hypothetical protein
MHCERKRNNDNAMTKNDTYIERFYDQAPYTMLVCFIVLFIFIVKTEEV